MILTRTYSGFSRGVSRLCFDIKAGKLGARTRQHTIDQQLNKFKGTSWGDNISVVVDVTAVDGDAGTVGVIRVRADLTYDERVTNVCTFCFWDVFVTDDAECVGSFDALYIGSRGSMTDTLAKAAQIVAIRGVPYTSLYFGCLQSC